MHTPLENSTSTRISMKATRWKAPASALNMSTLAGKQDVNRAHTMARPPKKSAAPLMNLENLKALSKSGVLPPIS